MRSKIQILALTLGVLIGITACSKKPDTSQQQQQPPATADNSATTATPGPPATTPSPEGNTSASAPAASSPAPAPKSVLSQTKAPAEAPPPAPKPKIVPAGTTLRVRLNQEIGSKDSQAGQTFTASVMDPVTVDGRTLIPAGSTVAGEVTNAKSAGRFKGGAELAITIRSVNVGGSTYPLSASTISQTSTGKGKRSAALIGGGAGLGALIGGLAGGGKGAAIGALAGGGAGTAGAGLTGNREIVLPAESAVSFKLKQSLNLDSSSQ